MTPDKSSEQVRENRQREQEQALINLKDPSKLGEMLAARIAEEVSEMSNKRTRE